MMEQRKLTQVDYVKLGGACASSLPSTRASRTRHMPSRGMHHQKRLSRLFTMQLKEKMRAVASMR
jgi:hypothetical protein